VCLHFVAHKKRRQFGFPRHCEPLLGVSTISFQATLIPLLKHMSDLQTVSNDQQEAALRRLSLFCVLQDTGRITTAKIPVLTGNETEASTTKKNGWTVPNEKPKRPLSAYNLYFQLERENIINSEDGQNYTTENIARVAINHNVQRKTSHPKRKVSLSILLYTSSLDLSTRAKPVRNDS